MVMALVVTEAKNESSCGSNHKRAQQKSACSNERFLTSTLPTTSSTTLLTIAATGTSKVVVEVVSGGGSVGSGDYQVCGLGLSLVILLDFVENTV